MLTIATEAQQQLVEFKNRKGPDEYIRIGILSGNTSGPNLGVTIDDKNENDRVFEFNNLKVIIDRALLEFCGRVEVHYVHQEGSHCSRGGGFKVVVQNPL